MAAIPAPEPGLVIRYDYLWTSDADAGRETGKDRPACVVVVIDRPGMPLFVGILPITHTPPAVDTPGVEIPERIRRKLGLDQQRCWVRVSEYNVELWPPPGLSVVPGSSSFAYGLLPPKFFNEIKGAFQSALAAGLPKPVHRADN